MTQGAKKQGHGTSDRGHWDAVYAGRPADEVSWFQAEPEKSLELIGQAGIATSDPVIDIGGGASVLVDRLWGRGFRDITVLDISAGSLAAGRARLGDSAARIEWLRQDVRLFRPRRTYALWHDRALFHFMTTPSDRAGYMAALREAVPPGGHVVIATFAIGGPRQCSGLAIEQYDAEKLLDTLGGGFTLHGQDREIHRTPSGASQLFAWFRLRRQK